MHSPTTTTEDPRKTAPPATYPEGEAFYLAVQHLINHLAPFVEPEQPEEIGEKGEAYVSAVLSDHAMAAEHAAVQALGAYPGYAPDSLMDLYNLAHVAKEVVLGAEKETPFGALRALHDLLVRGRDAVVDAMLDAAMGTTVPVPDASEEKAADVSPFADETAEMLRTHIGDLGDLIHKHGDALIKLERPDFDILDRLIEELREACALLWHVHWHLAGDDVPPGFVDLGGPDGPVHTLPLLLMAAERAADGPMVLPYDGTVHARWDWVAGAAKRAGKRLYQWSKAAEAEEVAHV